MQSVRTQTDRSATRASGRHKTTDKRGQTSGRFGTTSVERQPGSGLLPAVRNRRKEISSSDPNIVTKPTKKTTQAKMPDIDIDNIDD